jgi:multidrug efflux system membrane fusion protein
VRAGEAGGIVVVTQLQPISVAFSLPQQHLMTVNQAMAKGEVQVVALDADGKTVWEEGALSVVDNRIDVQTGTIRLKATFANPERKLWPGQFVNVRVRLDTYRDGNIVPAAAIQRNGSGTFAYVVDPEDRVELRPIRVGQIDGGIALVESGLEPGQRVVITSQEQLRPGARVTSTQAGLESGTDVSQFPSTIGRSAGTPPARGQRQRP